MTGRAVRHPAGPSEHRPGWVAPLTERAGRATWSDLSRFAPPADGSGRRSAVLVLLTQVGLSDVEPAQVDVTDVDLTDVDLTDVDLSDVDLSDVDLSDVDGVGVASPGSRALDRPGTAGPAVVLLERAATMRSHAGQVAFPGGAVDPGDPDRAATALREAEEEIGLDATSVDVLATLPTLFLPPSNFVVTPVLAFWREPHPLVRMQPAEVSSVAVVAVAELVDPVNRFTVRHPSGYAGPGFAAGGLFVWGFTAGVLDAVLRMGGWAQDWDPSVFRPVPAGALSAPSASAGTVEP